jgi:hypothetical protein
MFSRDSGPQPQEPPRQSRTSADVAIRGLVTALQEKDDLTIRGLLRNLSLYADHRILTQLYAALHQELGPPDQYMWPKS